MCWGPKFRVLARGHWSTRSRLRSTPSSTRCDPGTTTSARSASTRPSSGSPSPSRSRVRLAYEVTRFPALMRLLRGRRTTPVPGSAPRSIRDVLPSCSPPRISSTSRSRNTTSCGSSFAPSRASAPGSDRLELFSADGYYSCRIKVLSPRARVTGVELDPGASPARRDHHPPAGVPRCDLPPGGRVVIRRPAESRPTISCCAPAGLYHVSDPGQTPSGHETESSATISSSRARSRWRPRTPATSCEPARGWQHGCRFTHAWLRTRLEDFGWRVLEEARAELPGNPRGSRSRVELLPVRAHRTLSASARPPTRDDISRTGSPGTQPGPDGVASPVAGSPATTLRMTIGGQRPAVGHWSTVHGRIPHNRETVDSCRTRQAGMLRCTLRLVGRRATRATRTARRTIGRILGRSASRSGEPPG